MHSQHIAPFNVDSTMMIIITTAAMGKKSPPCMADIVKLEIPHLSRISAPRSTHSPPPPTKKTALVIYMIEK